MFVQPEIDHDIFMLVPDRCDELSGKIVKPNKPLCALGQSPRVFIQFLIPKLLLCDVERRSSEHCIFPLTGLDQRRMRLILGL